VNGQFVVVWHSYPDLDGDDFVGDFGQCLAVALFADGFESGATTAWTAP